MTQVVDHLSSKFKALNLKPSTTGKKEKGKGKKEMFLGNQEMANQNCYIKIPILF
jgi:hypothetical protein